MASKSTQDQEAWNETVKAKFFITREVFLDTETESDTDGLPLYIAWAPPGSRLSEPVWCIKKIIRNGTRESTRLANGNANFDKVYDDRATYEYIIT